MFELLCDCEYTFSMGLIYLIVHLVEVFTWGSCFGMGEAKTAALDFGEPGDYEVYNYNLNVTAFWRVWTRRNTTGGVGGAGEGHE